MTLNFARLREAVTLWFDHRGQMHVCTRQSVHITRSSARTNNDGGAKRGATCATTARMQCRLETRAIASLR